MSGSTIGAVPVGPLAIEVQERQAVALERIAEILEAMLGVMLADEEPEVDPAATLDSPVADPRDLDLPFGDHPTL